MSDPTATTLPPGRAEVEQALAGLDEVLAHSASLLARGDTVELAGLDGEAKAILDALLTLPTGDARALLPRLESVLQRLETIETTLRQGHGATGDERHARRIQAQAAYRRRTDP